ncbi:MAG: IS30 family transposase [Gammaproteobacteria bacterium]|nr:IS30 family transposase [Gammaproteobacteria bacterium]
MPPYSQLTEGQRYQVSALLKAVAFLKDIALNLGVPPSTISRELERNTGQRGYRPKQAQIKADRRKQEADKTIKMTFDIVNTIEAKILLDWSPEQVSGWLAKEESFGISNERIYQHIWTDKCQGSELFKHLRQSNKKRKKQYGSKDKRGQIRNRISIEERPGVVETKIQIGDW